MGERFGQYELLEPLASGGMARVYRARMVGAMGFEKIVAIKFMLPSFAADPMAVKMFVDEARLAATLSHANVVGILDFGDRDGTYYIAMEYVAGANLRVLLRRSAETERWVTRALAAYIGQEVARGLDYAHKKTDVEGRPLSIVHRDCSPQNIVVSWTGEVKILDFGIARSRQRSTETNAGTIKGKYSYMSPEQASGAAVDHRSDIYSLGLVLYELLTHQRAFPQPGPQVLPRVRAGDFIPPEKLQPDLSPKLLHILHRALARDVGNRYPSAGAMMDDLALYLAEERTHAGRNQGSGAEIARWAEDLFTASDNDFGTKVLAGAAGSPAEKSVLPGWESEPSAPPKMPRVDLTFSGADSAPEEAQEDDAIVDEPPIPASKVPTFTAPPVSPFTDFEEKPTKPINAASGSVTAARRLDLDAPTADPEPVRREMPAFKPVARVPRRPTAAIPPAPAPEPARRGNAIVFGIGAGVALLALAAGGLWIAVDPGNLTPTPTPTATATATPTPTPTPEPTREAAVADTSGLFARIPGTRTIGLLNLSSVPAGAEAWVDGQKIDRTPTLIPDLPAPKRYLVEIRKEGYADWSREVDIVDDTAVVIEAQLFPPEVPGKIKFRVPPRITAYLDGRLLGTGPLGVTVDAQPGPHQVRLRDSNDILVRQYELRVTSGSISELDIPPL